jgi:ELWxxDGT repeat protein
LPVSSVSVAYFSPPDTGIIRNFTIDYSSLTVPSNIGDFATHPANGRLYFTASEVGYGLELWSTDGNTAQLVIDLLPGPQSSVPTQLRPFNGSHILFASVGYKTSVTLYVISSTNALTIIWTTSFTVGFGIHSKADLDLQIGSTPGDVVFTIEPRTNYNSTYITTSPVDIYALRFKNLTSYTSTRYAFNNGILYNRGIVAGNVTCSFSTLNNYLIACSTVGTTNSFVGPFFGKASDALNISDRSCHPDIASSDIIDLPYNKPLGQAYGRSTLQDSLYGTPFGEFRFLASTYRNSTRLVSCTRTSCTSTLVSGPYYSAFNAIFAASPSAAAIGAATFVAPDGFVYVSYLNRTIVATGVKIFTPRPVFTSVELRGVVNVNGTQTQFGLARKEGFYPPIQPVIIVNSTAVIIMNFNLTMAFVDLGYDCSSYGCLFALYDIYSPTGGWKPTPWFYSFQTGTVSQVSSLVWQNNDAGIGGRIDASPYDPQYFLFASRENGIADLFIWDAGNSNILRINATQYVGTLFNNQGWGSTPFYFSSNKTAYVFVNSTASFTIGLSDATSSLLIQSPVNPRSVYSWLGAQWWISSTNDLVMLQQGQQPVTIANVGFPDQALGNASFPIKFVFSYSPTSPRWYAFVNGTVSTVSTGLGLGPSGPSTPLGFQPTSACVIAEYGNSSIDQMIFVSGQTITMQRFFQGSPLGNSTLLADFPDLLGSSCDPENNWYYMFTSAAVLAYGGFGTPSTIVDLQSLAQETGFDNARASSSVSSSGPPGSNTTFLVPLRFGQSVSTFTYYRVTAFVSSCAATAFCPFPEQSCVNGECLPYIGPPEAPPTTQPTASPISATAPSPTSCALPAPTLNSICSSSSWIIPGNLTIGPNGDVIILQIPSATIIQGNLKVETSVGASVTTVKISTGATLTVQGCVQFGGILELSISAEDLAKRSGTKEVISFDSQCNGTSTFGGVQVTGPTSSCDRVNASANYQPRSLSVIFSVVDTCESVTAGIGAGGIVGIVVAAVVVIGVIVAIVIYRIFFKKKYNDTEELMENPGGGPEPSTTSSSKSKKPKRGETPYAAIAVEDDEIIGAESMASIVSIPASDVTFLHKLGEGAFGSVRLGTLPDGSFVAVKTLANATLTSQARSFFAEASIMMQVSESRHVVQIHGIIADEGQFGIVMEFCPGGSLEGVLQKAIEARKSQSEKQSSLLPESRIFDFAYGIACGMESLASSGVIHRVRKPKLPHSESRNSNLAGSSIRIWQPETFLLTKQDSPRLVTLDTPVN